MNIGLDEIKTIGQGIMRPEGVMCLDDGTVLAADARSRIARIDPDGQTSFYGDLGGLPNGICLDADQNVIVADIGMGQVQLLKADGSHRVLAVEADGKRLYNPNFPFVDSKGRIWCSNSCYRPNLDDAIRIPQPDGCIFVIEAGQARIAAEDIYFANGVALDAAQEHLFVAASMERSIIRFDIAPDGSLGARSYYGPYPLAQMGYPDGIAFDEAGALWVTFPALNTVGYITPDQELVLALEDPENKILKRPTNICFGWEDRKTAFLGSLDGNSIPYFKVPHPGMKLVHQT